MRDADHQVLDALVRLIDPPLAAEDADADLRPDQQIESRFRQLPWAVEYAVIDWLHAHEPALFVKPPTDRPTQAPYPDAENDLKNAGHYYDRGLPSFILDYHVSPTYIERVNQIRPAATSGFGAENVEEWMRANGLYEPDEDNPDPHFAERAFVVSHLSSLSSNRSCSVSSAPP